MADILIPNMKMPKSCAECPMQYLGEESMVCFLMNCYNKIFTEKRPSWCPLVELPPHGDLIPYHAVRKAIVNYFGKDNAEWCDLMDEIDKIDVVVEGSRGSDN